MQKFSRKLKSKNTLIYVFFSLVMILSGCRGEDGPRGPAGRDGNANVMSTIYDVPPQNWSWTPDANAYTHLLSVPEITTDILDNGAVLVYRLVESDPSNRFFYMLPNTFVDTTSITNFDFNVYTGEIELILRYIDNGIDDTEVPGETESFKVVIIEGTPLSILKSKFDVTNYKKVAEYYGLTGKSNVIKLQ